MPSLLLAVHLAASAAVVSAVRKPIFPAANVSVGQVALANANSSHQANKSSSAPCQCETFNSQWKKPARRSPACLFMDLGAADGETYRAFLHTSKKWTFNYDSGSFKKEDCYAYLVEANPKFIQDLELLRTGKVYPMTVTAAYMCDKRSETFHLDVSGPGGWGSSLDSKHAAVSLSKQEVNVNLYNLMRLLMENAIPEDTVVVKMDIEGAEYDILPCLADSPAASLIDTLYLEDHCPGQWWCPTTGQAGNSKETFNKALAKLRSRGVNVPAGYWSPMF